MKRPDQLSLSEQFLRGSTAAVIGISALTGCGANTVEARPVATETASPTAQEVSSPEDISTPHAANVSPTSVPAEQGNHSPANTWSDYKEFYKKQSPKTGDYVATLEKEVPSLDGSDTIATLGLTPTSETEGMSATAMVQFVTDRRFALEGAIVADCVEHLPNNSSAESVAEYIETKFGYTLGNQTMATYDPTTPANKALIARAQNSVTTGKAEFVAATVKPADIKTDSYGTTPFTIEVESGGRRIEMNAFTLVGDEFIGLNTSEIVPESGE